MENFSRIDIFDTQGIVYLFVIGYLIIFTAFWNIAAKKGQVVERVKKLKVLSASALRIPQGLFHNRFHTWTHLDGSGEARIGLDDFIQHIVGDVRFTDLKKPGDKVRKGETLTIIEQNGKSLKILSPLSGEIMKTNTILNEDPEILEEYPVDKGWIYKIKPSAWKEETKSYFLAEDASRWLANELDRFKEFLSYGAMNKFSAEPSMTLLQDGGEIRNRVLSDLPGEVWSDFQKEFLNDQPDDQHAG
jgi:glycine cleavage system H protein